MNNFAKLSAGVFLIALSGCATPVPQSLTLDLRPDTFTTTTEASVAIWPQIKWWESFGDPELTALIVKAQDGNRDLAAAVARVFEARAQTTIAGAPLFPTLGAQASALKSGCGGAGCSQGQSFGLTFSASYELDFWGVNQGNLRAAEERLKSARFAQQSVALTLTANVAQEYLTVLELRKRIAIGNEEIAAVNGILEAIDVRVKAGSTFGLDRAREETQLEVETASVALFGIQEREALYALAVLLGQVPEGFDVGSKDLDAIHPPPVKPGLPADLLLRRPDVAAAEANLANAHANLDVARAAFFPQISLTGSGQFASTAIATLLHGSDFGFSYGVNLLQSIFDGGNLIGQKRLAEATEREYIADYQAAVLNAYADVESALTEAAKNHSAEDHLRRAVDAARRAFDITVLLFRQGGGDLLAVLQAQQILFVAEDELAQVEFASRQASVHLYEALGGGWIEAPEDRTQFAKEAEAAP